MQILSLSIPLPFKELMGNSRCHWAKKAKAVSYYRAIGNEQAILALQNNSEWILSDSKLHIEFTVHWKSEAKVDIHNVSIGIKAAMDGFFDALGMDDFCIDKYDVIRGNVDVKNPRIDVLIKKV